MKSWIHEAYQPKKIAVEGSIGAGKTVFATELSKNLGYPLLKEPVEQNPYLPLFYQDPKKYGFLMQIYMLTVRCSMERAGTYLIESGQAPGVVFDRTLAGDTCFAETNQLIGNLSSAELDVYLRLYSLMKYESPYPDIIFYLDVPPNMLLDRIILRRKRECENKITLEYLRLLEQSYKHFIHAIAQYTFVFHVDWSEFGDVAEVWKSAMFEFSMQKNTRFQKVLRH